MRERYLNFCSQYPEKKNMQKRSDGYGFIPSSMLYCRGVEKYSSIILDSPGVLQEDFGVRGAIYGTIQNV